LATADMHLKLVRQPPLMLLQPTGNYTSPTIASLYWNK